MNLYFQGGTLVLSDLPQDTAVPLPDCFQWIKAKWRCEAYHYTTVKLWLKQHKIRDSVPGWSSIKLKLHDGRKAHAYQKEALQAWDQHGRQGSIILPTGAGKTFVALRAIHRAKCSAVVVAPTIDLLHQWYARLVNTFEIEIGVYYGGEKNVQPLTVTTYHSAGDLMADYGNQFKLLIYDEVHHLPAPSWGETALMCPAPFRLGLTATYPEEEREAETADTLREPAPIYQVNSYRQRWRISDLIGGVVYEQKIQDLVGAQLAEYRTVRVRVKLTADEQQRYDTDFALYSNYFRGQGLVRRYGAHWLQALMRLSTEDEAAREALLARQRLQQLLAGSEEKLNGLEKLLQEHTQEQILIFTENNQVVYTIANRFLLPALTHETKTAERKAILDRFRSAEYPVIVTSKVLNEGVDVPAAKIAIVLGGTAGAREYIQRLGRVLRKVGDQSATLYELIVRDTVDEGRAQRRRPKKGKV